MSAAPPQPIKVAILAMGGEGGGVLADWLVDLAEHNGHLAQTTSVPGVAQRTGATIYYVEMFPAEPARQRGGAPVLALMPLPGDVDIVLASELMEAARAVQRGLVTPERTTLVTSTHRVYAIAEKTALGDGRVSAGRLLADSQAAARRFIGYDMAAAAEAGGSAISAVLFGALAGAGLLPFERAQFEATIERGGVGVKASLAVFGAAFERVRGSPSPAGVETVSSPVATPQAVSLPAQGPAGAQAAAGSPRHAEPAIAALLRRADAFNSGTRTLVLEGLRRLVDYQDPAYAALYLDRLESFAAAGPELGADLARHLALWMSYEDTVRVADLKTRSSRFERVRDEVRSQRDQLLHIEEYLHPRLQEIAESLPAALGRWLLHSGWPRRLVQRLGERGRTVRTSSLRGHLLLAAVAGLRRWRRGTLRFQLEDQRIEAWLADIRAALAHDPVLAQEIVRCQRLVKGYGDTHERGLRSFGLLRAMWAERRVDGPQLARLREAALADEHGKALHEELRQMAAA
ncbi:MAG: indolepyruvate oxidoreductase subunit beta family protein [Rubrivivax sp.]|nr:indolepyruvate oxidoreductase subunit beta family protein [Rubrivivax sp.]